MIHDFLLNIFIRIYCSIRGLYLVAADRSASRAEQRERRRLSDASDRISRRAGSSRLGARDAFTGCRISHLVHFVPDKFGSCLFALDRQPLKEWDVCARVFVQRGRGG